MNWPGRDLARAIFERALDGSPDAPRPTDEDVEAIVASKLGPLALHYFDESLPQSARTMLTAAAILAEERARRHEALLVEVAERFAGLPFLVLKGMHVGRWLYGDAALRPSVDVDVLLSPARFAEAGRRLRGAGFTSEMAVPRGLEAPFVRRDPPGAVDVHLAVWDQRIPVDGLFERSVAAELEGRAVRIPSPRDQAALLAAHFVHDLGGDLLHLLDVLVADRRTDGRENGACMRLARHAAWSWLGLDLGARGVPAVWRPVAAHWRRRGPTRGPMSRWEWWGFQLLYGYTCGVMRPRRIVETVSWAVWPANAGARWRRRLSKLLG